MIILKPILLLLSISGLSFYQNGKFKFIQNILFTLWLSSMILFATDFVKKKNYKNLKFHLHFIT